MENIIQEKEQHLNYFCVEVAEKYGVHEAVVLQSLAFWLEKNFREGRNLHDGLTWTFNSVEAMLQYFPYFTYNQLRRILNKLRSEGLIRVCNYNKMAYDKTYWYSFTELGEKLLGICVHYEEKALDENTNESVKKNKSICEKSQTNREKVISDMGESTHGNVGINAPIPVIETNIEKSFIENTDVESREGVTASMSKPVSLAFLTDARFVKLYNDIEEELFSQSEAAEMDNVFNDVPKEQRHEVIIAEMEKRLAKEKERRCRRNQELLEQTHNNNEAMAVVEKYYGSCAQIDDVDSLGRLYANVEYFFFDMAIREACECGITDGRAIYQAGMQLAQQRKEKKARQHENGYGLKKAKFEIGKW